MKSKEKKEKKLWKIIFKFIVVLVVCYFAGYLTGVIVRKMQDSGINLLSWVEPMKASMAYLVAGIFGVITIVEVVYCVCGIRKSKRLFNNWDGEDEEVIQRAEFGLDRCVAFSNIVMIMKLFLFAAGLVCLNYVENETKTLDIVIGIWYFLGFVIMIVVQRTAVQEEKKMNPEKKGEVLDIHFQNDWVGSCDEAQKAMIGEAAFKSVMVTNWVCIGLWCISVVGILSFNFGIIPVLFVTIIWLTSTITFQIAGRKLEYGNLLKK